MIKMLKKLATNLIKLILEKRAGILKFIVSIVQIAAAIATVVYAFLAWKTLNEMQTERINAYHPEIVATPGLFEGDLVKEVETEINSEEYMYIDFTMPNPAYCYDANPKLYNILEIPESYLCIEKPYLILKNIGLGTAKDIQVTFSLEWLEKAIARLNDNSLGYEYFISEGVDRNNVIEAFGEKKEEHEKEGVIICTVDGEEYSVINKEEEKRNIQYIGCDDGSVKVMLPEYLYSIFALYFYQNYKESSVLYSHLHSHQASFLIPDLEISIEYYDIQGESSIRKLTIPWTAKYDLRRSNSDSSEFVPINLRTCFYENYID